jgi:cold shock CspA family protein
MWSAVGPSNFDGISGHGLIRPDGGGRDVGFTTSDLALMGMGSPKVGSRLTYRLRSHERYAAATEVRRACLRLLANE